MDKKLWTAYEAAAATGGVLCAKGGDPDRWEAEEWEARGVAIDSRTLKPGEIFVALNDVRDGHEFLDNAFDAGASAALVVKAPADAPEGKPFLVVRDTLEGLRDLARAARLRNFGKRIAVTGSAGKTSTKDMLRVMLSGIGEVHAADRSFNNHFGVPLTLARMPMTSRFGVFEIGMNHAGEITPLVDLVRPHAAIITTVAPAHLEFFDSVEDIAKAKAEIFTGIKQGGIAVLPRDNEHFEFLHMRAKQSAAGSIVTFGKNSESDVRLLGTTPAPEGQKITASINKEQHTFTLGAFGEHQAMNALAALGAALGVGAPLGPCLKALANFQAGDGRGAQQEIDLPEGRGSIILLDESYNANPASMAAALSLLGSLQPKSSGKRIAVLGEMLELGADGNKLHAGISTHLAQAKVEKLYASGALMQALWNAVPGNVQGAFTDDPQTLAKKLIDDLHDGDIIMVKGSNASKVSLVAQALKELALGQEE